LLVARTKANYLGPGIRKGMKRKQKWEREERCRCMIAAGKRQQLQWLKSLRPHRQS
jgi:hypothetical protein